MEDEKTLIISDKSGLHPIDIDSASKREACYPGKANQMAKLNAKTREGVAIFAGCFEDGSVRLFRDQKEGQGIQKVIAEEKVLGNGGMKAAQKKYASGKGAARNVIQLPNGALVVSFADNSIEIWEEMRKAGGTSCACCTIF